MIKLDKQNKPNKFVWLVVSLLTVSISACTVNKREPVFKNEVVPQDNNQVDNDYTQSNVEEESEYYEDQDSTLDENCEDQYCYIEIEGNNLNENRKSNFSYKNEIRPIIKPDVSNDPDDFLISTHVKRNYNEIPKGSYKYDTYTVKRGDTLYYIGWITGLGFQALSEKNNIPEPYALEVGQVLDVSKNNTKSKSIAKQSNVKKVVQPAKVTNTTKFTNSKINNNSVNTTNKTNNNQVVQKNTSTNVNNINFIWPVKGQIITAFTKESKGIDIAGKLGDRINASADGVVVYAGNALPGYGNIIIIKHNEDYLTAYAHNQTIMVKELDAVKAGQQIATMGSTGTSSTRLHFEVRYKVKSVDPMQYLPKQ